MSHTLTSYDHGAQQPRRQSKAAWQFPEQPASIRMGQHQAHTSSRLHMERSTVENKRKNKLGSMTKKSYQDKKEFRKIIWGWLPSNKKITSSSQMRWYQMYWLLAEWDGSICSGPVENREVLIWRQFQNAFIYSSRLPTAANTVPVPPNWCIIFEGALAEYMYQHHRLLWSFLLSILFLCKHCQNEWCRKRTPNKLSLNELREKINYSIE